MTVTSMRSAIKDAWCAENALSHVHVTSAAHVIAEMLHTIINVHVSNAAMRYYATVNPLFSPNWKLNYLKLDSAF